MFDCFLDGYTDFLLVIEVDRQPAETPAKLSEWPAG